jgi:hypothetical protein
MAVSRRHFIAAMLAIAACPVEELPGIIDPKIGEGMRHAAGFLGDPREWRCVLAGNAYEIPLTIAEVVCSPQTVQCGWGELVEITVHFEPYQVPMSQMGKRINVFSPSGEGLFSIVLEDTVLVGNGSASGSMTVRMARFLES